MVEGMDTFSHLGVRINKVSLNGHFIATPSESDDYVTFLAKLNNFYNGKGKSLQFVTKCEGHDKIYAIRCKTPKIDSDIWYRGRVLSAYKATGGTLANILLVDEGEKVFVPLGISVHELDNEFINFPIQHCECILYGLKPLNYVTSPTDLIKKEKSVAWDISAIKVLSDAIKGKTGILLIHKVDKSGCFHVTLTIRNHEGNEINVNKMLVDQGFALFEPDEDGGGDQGSANNSITDDGLPVCSSGANTSDDDLFHSLSQREDETEALKRECEMLQQKRLQLLKEGIVDTLEGTDVRKQKKAEKTSSKSPVDRTKRVQFDDESTPTTTLSNGRRRNKSRGKDLFAASFSSDTDTSSPEKEVTRRNYQSKGSAKEPKTPTISDDDFELFKTKVKDKKRRLKESSPSSEDSPMKGNLVDSDGLLAILTKQAKSRNIPSKQTDDNEWPELDDVLRLGKGVTPARCLETLHIPSPMLAALGTKQFQKPTPLQAHMWPSVVRGRDVIGVGPRLSGKTTASIIPILTQVVETQDSYSDVPISSGPLVLILVSSWRKVESLAEQCKKWVYHYRKIIKVNGIYSGHGNPKDQAVSLMNGCDILVATPPCMNKMLQNRHTDLERLCHVVIDDADVVVELYTDDVKDLMRTYAAALRETKRGASTRQFVANASEWTRGLTSLVKAYFQTPLILVSSGLEAAAFSSVSHSVEVCLPDEKLQCLKEYLETHESSNNIVVFVESAKSAEELCEALEKLGFPTLMATEYFSTLQLKDMVMAWNASRSPGIADYILVTTDGTDLKIRNATCIVHYDFPRSKVALSMRLDVMLENMKAKISDEDLDTRLTSYFIMTDKSFDNSPGLIKLLKRCGQVVPENLVAISDRATQEKEDSRKGKDLCESLKLFGQCSDLRGCRARHTFFADVDHQSHLPTCGTVKIIILDVLSASHFIARIIEHKPPSSKPNMKEYQTHTFVQLGMDMQLYYAKEANRVRPKIIEVNEIYAVGTANGFIRVRVLYASQKNADTGLIRQVKAFGIDIATEHLLMVEELLVLPDELRSVPSHAIEVVVGCVKPVEQSFDWTAKACFTIEKLVLGATLEGRIAFSLTDTLWLDPLVEKTKLESLNAMAVSLNVATELIRQGFGERNPTHMKTLRNMAKGVITLPDADEEAIPDEQLLPEDTMEVVGFPEGEFHDVYVSAVINPDCLYVQLLENLDRLDRLEEKIHAVMNVFEKRGYDSDEEGLPTRKKCPKYMVGSLCVAKFSQDDRWYRGQISSCNAEDSYEILFFDHGDDDVVPLSNIRPAWPEILTLPKQAIECKLNNVKPLGTEWASEDADALWAKTEGKLLQAKVLSKQPSSSSSNQCYEIVLFDATQEHTLNISHELVFSGHAKGSDQLIQEMFPEAAVCPQETECHNEYQRIPYLCLQIYKSEDDTRLSLVKALQSIVKKSENFHDQIRESGGLKCLCQVFALVNDSQLQQMFMTMLVQICKGNEKNMDELRKARGLQTICSILAKTENEELLQHSVSVLKNVATTQSNKSSVRIYGGLNCLCKILEKTDNAKVRDSVLQCLDVLCVDNDQNCITLRQVKGIPRIVELLKDNSKLSSVESCLKTVKTVSMNARNRDELRDCGCIQGIYTILSRNPSEQTLLFGVQTLKNLALNNHINADLMRNIGLESFLQSLGSSTKRSHIFIKKVCGEVLHLIQSSVSPFKEKSRVMIPKIDERLKACRIDFDEYAKTNFHPLTRWSQQKTTITLAVKLLDVQKSQVLLSENRVVFRAISNEELYGLDLELFAAIKTETHTEKMLGSEVLITLQKKDKSVWPRLLSGTVKLPYLSIDFDRWVDEFSESEDETIPAGPNIVELEKKLASYLQNDIPSDYDSDSSDSRSSGDSIPEEDFTGNYLTENFL